MTTLSPLSSRNMTTPTRDSSNEDDDDGATIPLLLITKPKPDMDDATPPPVNTRTSDSFAVNDDDEEEDTANNIPFDENVSPIRQDETGETEQQQQEETGVETETAPVAAAGVATIQPQQQQQQQDPDEAESIALARMLMEQEAIESYGALSADYLRYNSHLFSQDDLAALQAAMADDEVEEEGTTTTANNNDNTNNTEQPFSYDVLLRLGESIGDVKKERWSHKAQAQIDKLPLFTFDPKSVVGKDENDTDVKCLVCQFPYEEKEELRRLPCGHAFHSSCVAIWLKDNDICPYCRQTIVVGNDE